MRTDRLTVRVLEAEPVDDLDFAARTRAVPVGITELTVDGVPYLPLGLSADPVELPCGSGPPLRVGDALLPTAVDRLTAPAGSRAPRAGRAVRRPTRSRSRPATTSSTRSAPSPSRSRRWCSTPRRGRPATARRRSRRTQPTAPTGARSTAGTDDRVVVLHENVNAGWAAALGGADLDPVTVDGWQQGFLLPAGDAADRRASRSPTPPTRPTGSGLVAGARRRWSLLGAALLLHPPPLGRPRPPARRPGAAADRPCCRSAPRCWPACSPAGSGCSSPRGAAALAWALDRWLGEAAPLLLALPCLVATLPYLVTPWGSADGWAGNSAWPHYLVLVPLVSVLVLACEPARPRRPRRRRFFSRRAGRSTTR